MKRALAFGLLVFTLSITTFSNASARTQTPSGAPESGELDPFQPGVAKLLQDFDAAYESQTGLASHLAQNSWFILNNCYRNSCRVWAVVSIAKQKLKLFIDGQEVDRWLVSTGKAGHDTPAFDRHPDGRIYDRYTSTRFPEGDYHGLGNMPYAVFIQDGFALHGTPEGNWKKLGHKASHGCIRQHPDKALYFNRLVRSMGIENVWITVQ